MSITNETAKEHAKDTAITCCRFEAGTVIEPSNLEDPYLFPDLEDSGLLVIPDNALTIEEVLGAKLTKTIDALTPLTEELLEGVNKVESNNEAEEVAEVKKEEKVVEQKSANTPSVSNGGVFKLHIGEGKDINIEIPMGNFGGNQNNVVGNAVQETAASESVVSASETEVKEAKVMGNLTKKYYKIDEVKLADETKIEDNVLYLRKNICEDAVDVDDLVLDISFDIITPDRYDEYSETLMDIQPIATKVEGELGSGVTKVIDGVVVVVTGTDENGVQIGEFGSSEGIIDKNVMWNRPGAPDKGDIFIKTEVKIVSKMNMERPGPFAAHKATDFITQEIRDALKGFEGEVLKEEKLAHKRNAGKKKVVIIKEIMGQGAMHDNLILPFEPVGILGGKPNVDLGNLPIVLSPLEVLDGGVHALTCIGPASKETSRHYWREPLVKEALLNEDIDLCGVIFVGSPQVNSEKFYVSKRLGALVEMLDVDGAIITTEGFGNNHIDFASHHEQVGIREIPVVGMTFSARQGALVVGNKYMKNMVDLNKSKQGIENEILSNNTLCQEDAVRAIEMLRSVMNGETVKKAERKWNANVKVNNVEIIEETKDKKIELVKNEQVLDKSKKRLEIYEQDESN